MAEKIISKPKKRRPPKVYRLWPEVRKELLSALRELKRESPRTKELDAVHGAMLMWSRSPVSIRKHWVAVARTGLSQVEADANVVDRIEAAGKQLSQEPKERRPKGKVAL